MKTYLLFIFLLLSTVISYSQSPNKMTYQAVVRNQQGKLVQDKTVGLRISILQGTTTGNVVYSETHKPKSNENGLVSVAIGEGSVVNGSINLIDWSKGPFFLKTETDPDGGASYPLKGTSQLLSVPYALYAENAGIKGYSIGDVINGGIIIWLDETKQHGLLAAFQDVGQKKLKWAIRQAVETMAVGTGPLAGEKNTPLILSGNGRGSESYAALECAIFVDTVNQISYGDWYLPSKDELKLIYNNSTLISHLSIQNGGNSLNVNESYWSSTEFDVGKAFSQKLNNASQSAELKSEEFYVRPVRRF